MREDTMDYQSQDEPISPDTPAPSAPDIPPMNPPDIPPMNPPQNPQESAAVYVRPRGVFSRALAVVAAVALFVSGTAIGLWVGDDRAVAPSPEPIPVVAPTTTSATTDEPATIATIDGGGEPVADVAEALLPAMVAIEVAGGVGSGVIYDTDGLILTAAHVVAGFNRVTVRLSDGTRLDGTVLGSDAGNDIAVIEVDRSDLPAAPLALDAPPRVGQLAIAIGSPWGLNSTVTSGIVSAVDRPLGGSTGLRTMIQTDASINPGNSGGALADRDGRVIGINVSIFSETGANDGVGFAVPINRAFGVAEAIVSGGDFVGGFLGIIGEDSPVGQPPGAVVTSVQPESGAELAGFEIGDLIVAVDGVAVSGIGDLAAQISNRQAGDSVTLTVLRAGGEIEVEAELGAR